MKGADTREELQASAHLMQLANRPLVVGVLQTTAHWSLALVP